MHSVNHAIEQGRDVFVVPANIDAPTSQASNALISEGFQSAATGWQVLRDYVRQFPKLTEEIREEREVSKPPIRVATAKEKPERSAKKVIDKDTKEVYIDLEAVLKDRSEPERAVLNCLGAEPVHVDELIANCDLPVQKVNVCLTTLAIGDFIKEHPGKRYSLNPKIRSSR